MSFMQPAPVPKSNLCPGCPPLWPDVSSASSSSWQQTALPFDDTRDKIFIYISYQCQQGIAAYGAKQHSGVKQGGGIVPVPGANSGFLTCLLRDPGFPSDDVYNTNNGNCIVFSYRQFAHLMKEPLSSVLLSSNALIWLFVSSDSDDGAHGFHQHMKMNHQLVLQSGNWCMTSRVRWMRQPFLRTFDFDWFLRQSETTFI